ncbi:hypothetical protein RchiOBHm_Chr3g0474621 [Rosa chinensis]|uniref:DUF7148 domain-containing protein n=1 Tax=Rosa chinensis TaxID=74649 RepID=A0A2P6RC69_ROSCH|nr:uncharacterized protein LOC112193740 [Rosa chinensis]PRQ44022.1 hypothetical protein RchiOBHm_Chr3g0474621 [Rosa chinensis]
MATTAVNMKLLHFHSPRTNPHAPSFSPLLNNTATTTSHAFPNNLSLHSAHHSHPNPTAVAKAALDKDSLVPSDDAEDGVLLGTMKLPDDTDFPRFQILLFQWANSLCQGANLPLDMPLKVDKIAGGTRLGFITIGDGETEVIGYIDCLVFPPEGGSGPIFRAVRNGRLKDRVLPGEPRIMRNLMQALQKSVQIARVY